MVKNAIFFFFLEKMAKLCRMFNIGFLGAFRGPKHQSPAKYHISGHYITKYGFLKNRIFGDFFDDFLDFANLIRGRDRPEVAGPIKY